MSKEIQKEEASSPKDKDSDLKEFIQKKKIQNDALKKIIDKLNSSEKNK